jgi:histidinol-phosphate phosphatase family protein
VAGRDGIRPPQAEKPEEHPTPEGPGDSLTAVVLAGGFGTRLRAVVSDCPKVLAEVNGRPFLAYLLDQLVRAGVDTAVLCTGYKAEQIEAAFGDVYRGMRLRYSRETEPLGTAGAIRLALPLIESEEMLVLNGDSYCAADFAEHVRLHRAGDHHGSLLLTPVPDASRFGQVLTRDDGRVTDFLEKDPTARAGWINAGVYVFQRHLLREIPLGRAVSLEREMLPNWIPRGLGTLRSDTKFLDIGTPESYREAAEFFATLNDPFSRDSESSKRSESPQPRSAPLRKASESRLNGRAIFLDRDGTIIRERHHLCDPELVELLPGAAEGLRRMREMGFALVVVTNQSVIGRGLIDEPRLEQIHARMRELLRIEGVDVDAIFHCPHTPDDGCDCRKPATGMIDRACEQLRVRPEDAFVIGDKACDIELGRAVGATTILVRTGYGLKYADDVVPPDYVGIDLTEAAEMIRFEAKRRKAA